MEKQTFADRTRGVEGMEKQGKTEPEEEIRKGLGGERWGVKSDLSVGGLGRPCRGTSEVQPPGAPWLLGREQPIAED